MNRLLSIIFVFISLSSLGQKKMPLNHDESKVRKYTLPNPLIANDGSKIESAKQWQEKRRPEIIKMISDELYGHVPDIPVQMKSKLKSTHTVGNICYKQVVITLSNDRGEHNVDVLICLPAQARKPVPAIVCMNFFGNHTITHDPDIVITKFNDGKKEKSRGYLADRWPLEMITSKGYAVVTLSNRNIALEKEKAFISGVYNLFPARTKKDWGTIRAWAWGMSRVVDYLETDKQIDSSRLAVSGTSRLGGTSLLAGAMDERFKVVLPNVSGKNGASLLRRNFGQSVENLVDIFPYWFCENFKKYRTDIDSLPVDQHMLISLVAPRPIYLARAEDDSRADNYGSFLSLKNAEPVYALFGKKGLGIDTMPKISQPVLGTLGFHVRPGKHGIENYDWQCFLNFLDHHMKDKN